MSLKMFKPIINTQRKSNKSLVMYNLQLFITWLNRMDLVGFTIPDTMNKLLDGTFIEGTDNWWVK